MYGSALWDGCYEGFKMCDRCTVVLATVVVLAAEKETKAALAAVVSSIPKDGRTSGAAKIASADI